MPPADDPAAPPPPPDAAAPRAARLVPCPGCRRPTPYAADNPWRPFCSERCRRGDLGAWASEQYRVAVPPSSADDGPGDDDGRGLPTGGGGERAH